MANPDPLLRSAQRKGFARLLSDAESPATTGRTRRLSTGGRLMAIAAVCLVAGTLSAASKWSENHALMINVTDSLPNWAFVVEARRFPVRGDYVVFHPGHDPITVKYFGSRPAAFTKIALGLPGDTVTRIGNDVHVNGKRVATIKPMTKRGDRLAAGPLGVVPEGCIFAGTPHKDGFDSRYAHIGFVCRDRLVGTGQPIL